MDKNITGLAHIGVFVKDIGVSKKFYCEKLDFKLLHENVLHGNGADIKVAFVGIKGCVLELVQLPEYQKRNNGVVDHIAFSVKDIEKTAGRLREKGIVFKDKDITFVPHFFKKGDKWIFFEGPDGESLEINEIL